jgi:hypothetical protein
MKMSRHLAHIVFAGLLLLPSLAPANPQPQANTSPGPATNPNYKIAAGNGTIGFSDGPATQASFMMPEAMAYGPNGMLYITDTAAQRIRALTPAGRVITVAGSGAINPSGMWVTGGYRDGLAQQAQFNRPMGIAVNRLGVIYIADTENHCIRRIENGRVSTFAGGPARPGSVDGPVAMATFQAPRALVFDAEQNLYIADAVNNNVRIISPTGIVTTMQTGPLFGPSGLTTAFVRGREQLWLADKQGIAVFDVMNGSKDSLSSYPQVTDTLPPINGAQPLGRPQALVVMGDDEAVYTDALDNAVKFVRSNQNITYLGEVPRENAMLTGGGPQIGPDGPRWNSPLGIVRTGDGGLIVADAGNRRLIRIKPIDTRQPLTIDKLNQLSFAPHAYRIAVVGPSYVWYTTDFAHSIGGLLAARLSKEPSLRSHFRAAQAAYFRVGAFQGEVDLIDNVLSEGTVDMVVWVVTPYDGNQSGRSPDQWVPALRNTYEQTAQVLRKNNIALEMLVMPSSISLSPLECVEYYNRQTIESSDFYTQENTLDQALRGVDASVVNLYPVFRHEIEQVNHQPLYAPDDIHLTPYARNLAVRALADYLTHAKPWATQGGENR